MPSYTLVASLGVRQFHCHFGSDSVFLSQSQSLAIVVICPYFGTDLANQNMHEL
jgi:hypothetical protein